MPLKQHLVGALILSTALLALADPQSKLGEGRAQDVEFARLIVGHILNGAGHSGFSAARLIETPGFIVEKDSVEVSERRLAGRLKSSLVKSIEYSTSKLEDPAAVAQYLSVDFLPGPLGNQPSFLEDCFSIQDLKQLMSSLWTEVPAIHHSARFDLKKDDGDCQYMLRTYPGYFHGAGACLKKIQIFYLCT